jgi:hypothetical protein
MESQHVELHRLISENARTTKHLTAWVRGLAILCGLTIFGLIWVVDQHSVQAKSTDENAIVTARGLVIVDDHGKIRLRIGAPLPEPIIMGKRQKRDDSISGILLYDALGNERGGYVTDNSVGNAFMTLDSNIGQEVTLVAYPEGGAEFGLNDDTRDKVVLSALKTGPLIRLNRAGITIFQQPPSTTPKH